ncbi:helix-turn-helix transcriptional regulator [Dysgonomonas sp. HDW5A]|uniref:helix-turn-helix transcriptional regulator n=1 Tax=Dysgonomonas sp. HDW5A TaxID=2714926 RepID=UPI00140792EA|nr:helix-turn-helix transcriptional regulator [Dysgonomonas sp. HDW5A]QIK58558.1 helix-turn-helix transcriptional regulator [Dysgonomonas sp. HDW5A]
MGKELGQTLKNIEQIRNAKGFTLKYIASRLDTKQAVSALIMKGERGLLFKILEQIAMIFEIDITDIIKYPDKYKKQVAPKNN